ncbi:MAG: N-acetyltransferase [Clostridia bacterium]|nr:N-acetyltransferase [Clostridia bacterium]
MISVREVKGSRDIKKFVDFPIKLYKRCEYFVPCLYSDEKKLLSGKTSYDDVAESAFFLAERDGEVVGRIQAIIQRQHNELTGERRVRFTRFDAINDPEVSAALFRAVEDFGRSRGMDIVCGPLGYSDLDREGMLIEGFDQTQTFEEQYNYDYYPALTEAYGFEKEIDWLEFRLFAPEDGANPFKRIAERVLEMQKLHVADASMPKREYIEKYGDGAFHCIDECYKHLYGTVPITEGMKKELIDQFMLVLDPKYLVIICDENERVVSFALCFPAMGEALRKSGGKLTPAALVRLFRALKKPRAIDLGLVAVLPEYQNAGVNAVYMDYIITQLTEGGIEYFETNLNLETNTQVMAQWKYLKAVNHKRRRAYVKKID